MEKFILSVGDLSSISIYTDIEKVSKKLSETNQIKKTIPVTIKKCQNANTIEEQNNYILILKNDKKYVEINKDLNIANILVKPEELFFPDITYLTIGMFANDLQSKGYYFIQSSVVKYDDEHSVMIVGDPGSGKTTMAYSLMKEYGFKLIANDNVLVSLTDNGLETYKGTKPMQMRYGVIKDTFPEILPYVNELEDDKKSNWDKKVFIDNYLHMIGSQYADNSIITDIYNITVNANGSTYIKEREDIDKLLFLHEQLTKQIRSNRYALVSLDTPLPSFENEKFLQERYDMARKIQDKTKVYDARGTAKVLTKRIGNKYGY